MKNIERTDRFGNIINVLKLGGIFFNVKLAYQLIAYKQVNTRAFQFV